MFQPNAKETQISAQCSNPVTCFTICLLKITTLAETNSYVFICRNERLKMGSTVLGPVQLNCSNPQQVVKLPSYNPRRVSFQELLEHRKRRSHEKALLAVVELLCTNPNFCFSLENSFSFPLVISEA